jgi:hypothetical protein
VSREVVEAFGGGLIAEASQSGSIVVVDEGVDEGVALGVVVEAVAAEVGLRSRMGVEGFGEAAVEALGHAVGLRAVGPGELVAHAVGLADLVEGMSAGSGFARAPAGVAEAVGELRAVVGQDGVDGVAEALEEACEAGGDGGPAAVLDDLHMDEAGGPLDGHDDIGRPALQPGQVLQVEVHIAERRGREALRGLAGVARSLRDAPALEEAVQRGARDVGSEAAAHHLQGVVQRQPQPGAQLHGDLLLLKGEPGGQDVRPRRAVEPVLARLPSPDRRLADAQLPGQLRHRFAAGLDLRPHLRGGRRVGVQLHEHRRPSSQAMPKATPSRSSQPPETQHGSGDPGVFRC